MTTISQWRTVQILDAPLSSGTALRGVCEILMKTESGVGSTGASDSLAKLYDSSRTSLESAYLICSKSSYRSPVIYLSRAFTSKDATDI